MFICNFFAMKKVHTSHFWPTLWRSWGLSLLSICLMLGLLPAQTYYGSLYLSTQAQVDAFSYTTITGNLTISGSDITQLDGLASLHTLGGNLDIRFNSQLTNVDGLAGLTLIPGRLWIRGNPALANLNGLGNVVLIGDFLGIDDNDALYHLDGLHSLVSVGKQVAIENNATLFNINGLANLTSIGEWLFFTYNDALPNLDGLSGLTSIGASLDLRYNTALRQIDGLAGLTAIPGRAWITQNPALESLEGLANVTSIGGVLGLDFNPALRDLDGLRSLVSVAEQVAIAHNASLRHVDGLANLRDVGLYLNLHDNANLSDCCGLYPYLTERTRVVPVSVFNNLSGCTVSSILADCATEPVAGPWKELGPMSSPITVMGYDGSTWLYAHSQYGIYRSADWGDTWELWHHHVGGELAVGKEYAPGENGFAFLNGVTYTLANHRQPDGWFSDPPELIATAQVPGLGYVCSDPDMNDCMGEFDALDFVQFQDHLLIATQQGIWHKQVSAPYWQVNPQPALTLAALSGYLLAAAPNGSVWKSVDKGQTWLPYSAGNLPAAASAFVYHAGRVFATVPGHGVFRSQNGAAWVPVNQGLGSLQCVDAAICLGDLYIGTSDAWVWKSADHGQTWAQALKPGQPTYPISSLFSTHNRLFATGTHGVSRKATGFGSDSWSHSADGMANTFISWIAARNDHILAAQTIGGYDEGASFYEGWIYQSENPYRGWSAQNLGAQFGIAGLQQQEDLVLVYTQGRMSKDWLPEIYSYYLTGSGPAYGSDWCYDDYTHCQWEDRILSTAAIGDHLFYVPSGWYHNSSQLAVSPTRGFNDDTQFSFTYTSSLNQPMHRLRVIDGRLYACTDNGIFYSTNLGQTWTTAGLQGRQVYDLTVGNNFWIALTNQGLYRSWKQAPAVWYDLGVGNPGPYLLWTNKVLYAIYRDGANSELRYSLDKGESWQILPTDPEMPALNPYALAAEGNDYLFVGTEGRGIWRHPLLNPPAARLAGPEGPTLLAYPNPNQGLVTIELPEAGQLDLMDLQGRHLRQVTCEAGPNQLSLKDLPAGTYLLRFAGSTTVLTTSLLRQ